MSAAVSSPDGSPAPAPRWRRYAIVVVIAFLLYTLFGFFIVPRIIRGQIISRSQEQLHRVARVDDVRFNPFTLTTVVTGFHLADRDGVELVGFDRLLVNAELRGLLRRAYRFSEIRIERPRVAARILRDGTTSISDLLDSGRTVREASPDQRFQLPRIIVEHLLVTSGVVEFSDASRTPTYVSRFEPLNLDVTDLITIPREGGGHALTIGVENGAQLRWTGRQTVEPLEFTGRLDITGVQVSRLWDYFGTEQPLDVRDGRLELVLPYQIRRGTSSPFEVRLNDASARLQGLVVRPKSEMTDWLTLGDIEATGVGVAWPSATIDVANIAIRDPRVLARLDADGSWNWQHALAGTSSPPSSGTTWRYQARKVNVERGTVHVEATAAVPAATIDLSEIAVQLENVTSNTSSAIPFTSHARVNESGTIEAKGTVAPSPISIDVAFDAKSIDMTPLEAYVYVPPGIRIDAGTASLHGRVQHVAAKNTLNVTADGALDGVELHGVNGERLVAWRSMIIDGFSLEDPPNRARIRTVTFDQPFAKVEIDKQGNLNLTQLFVVPPTLAARGAQPRGTGPADAAVAVPASAPSSAKASTTLEIGTVAIREGAADFSDQSLPLSPFSTQIHSANGTIKDLSSFAAAPATVNVEGRVDKTGFVQVGGTLRTADPMAASEITMEFRSIEMPALTPYFAEFAGYAVKSGVMDLNVRYQVQSRRLIGNHTVVARDLVLGERIAGAKLPGFAVRLAVALLKDRQGRINVEVPIQGTVDSPEFNYRSVFMSALKTIMGNAVKAPFRALGRLFGKDEDDLELVEFDPGRSDLLPAEQDTLTRLAEQLAQRGDIGLTIEGRFDAKADPPAIRRAKLDALIEARRPAATAATAAGSSALETILESLFTEQFSAEALQAERQRFSAPAAGSPPGTGAPAVAATPPPPSAAAQSGAGSSGGSAGAQGLPASAFDAAGFYESLRQKLLEAQQVSSEDLSGLATARATTIAAVLTKGGALTTARLKTAPPAAVKRSKKDSARIASELSVDAGDEGNTDADSRQ